MDLVDPVVYARHRRTIVVDTLPYSVGEGPEDRVAKFFDYMRNCLEIPDEVIGELGAITVRRPPSKRKKVWAQSNKQLQI